MKKKTYIVSTYNNYEWITTKDAYCRLQLMVTYAYRGYQLYEYPLWFAVLVNRICGKKIWGNRNCTIEKYIQGSDQITHHTPYHDFY
jgi:hypothetical protein